MPQRIQQAKSPVTAPVRTFSRRNERGALWLKETKSGVAYLSGYVRICGNRRRLVLFCNQNDIKGPKDNQPMWRVFLPGPMA